MARRRDTSPSDLLHNRGYALGQLLSQVFHPIPVNIATFGVAGYFGVANHMMGLAWAGLCVVAAVLPPTLFYLVRLRQGVYGDEDISDRRQRNELYLVGFVWSLVITIVLAMIGAPRAILAVMLLALAMGLIGGVVNLFWKISVHSASIAALATVALLYSPSLGIALWLCALAVGWARVRTGNHTPMQVLAGFLSAAIVVLAVFQLLGRVGSVP
jgi:membrane-associated phospholipid phosphatase